MKQPSKREKRIAREKLRLQKQAEKSARLRKEPLSGKGPRIAAPPSTGKEPRVEKNPGSIAQMIMEWSVEMADTKEHWSWGDPRQWSNEHWEEIIGPALYEFSKLSWAEIWSHNTGGKDRHRKHHDMEVANLCDEATNRWYEIGDYGETTFRFRLGNRRRLWGYKQVNKFHLIWWDPNHMIYPTDPE